VAQPPIRTGTLSVPAAVSPPLFSPENSKPFQQIQRKHIFFSEIIWLSRFSLV